MKSAAYALPRRCATSLLVFFLASTLYSTRGHSKLHAWLLSRLPAGDTSSCSTALDTMHHTISLHPHTSRIEEALPEERFWCRTAACFGSVQGQEPLTDLLPAVELEQQQQQQQAPLSTGSPQGPHKGDGCATTSCDVASRAPSFHFASASGKHQGC